MEISPTPAAAATGIQPATLFVALELSKAKWLVGLHSPAADKISRHTIAGGDAPALLSLIEVGSSALSVQLTPGGPGQDIDIPCLYRFYALLRSRADSRQGDGQKHPFFSIGLLLSRCSACTESAEEPR